MFLKSQSAHSQHDGATEVLKPLNVICDAATPSAPFGITMLSCDGASITLAWKSPKHCGGSKVNAYYVDKRNADSLVWKEVNQSAITERTCTVSDITHTHTIKQKKLTDVSLF